MGAGRDDDPLRLHLARVLALGHEHHARAGDRDRARAEQELRPGGLHLVDQRPAADEVPAEVVRARDPETGPRLLEDLAARGRPLVDDRNGQAFVRRLDPGGEARRATADHEDVVGLGAHLRPRLWFVAGIRGRRQSRRPRP